MDQKASDQGWQQLQAHIEGFFGRALVGDRPGIEYKPRFSARLLARLPDNREAEQRDRLE